MCDEVEGEKAKGRATIRSVLCSTMNPGQVSATASHTLSYTAFSV